MTGRNSALCLSHIAKKYGKTAVLRDVSLSVAPGECVALTGPNGCGKSTLLRIAAGLTRPTGGAIQAEGQIQYVPEAFPPIDLSLRRLFSALEQVDCLETMALAREFQLEGALDAPIRTFSKGMLSKVAAIQALAADAHVLLLDEPVSGQDEASRAVFCTKVREKLRGGTAVLMACHEESLIQALADRVCRIESGGIAEGASQKTDLCLCAKCELYKSGACAGQRGCSRA